VTITWSSACLGFGAVHYGFDPSQLNGLVLDSHFVQSHTVVVNLTVGSTYFYNVSILNKNGVAVALSPTQSFTFLAAAISKP
jgi:hypothetical protein